MKMLINFKKKLYNIYIIKIKVMEKYKIIKTLGDGAYGSVF